MTFNQFSYWLSVEGPDSQKVDAWLREREWVPSFLDGNLEDAEHGEYSVNEKLGTIEEWPELEEILLECSTICPNTTLSLRAQDEEDKSRNKRLIWRGGVLVHSAFSRVVDADDEIDAASIMEAVNFLEELEEFSAAEKLRRCFL